MLSDSDSRNLLSICQWPGPEEYLAGSESIWAAAALAHPVLGGRAGARRVPAGRGTR